MWGHHEGAVYSVSLSPEKFADGYLLASAGTDGKIRLWKFSNIIGKYRTEFKSKQVQVLHGHKHTVNFVSFSPDGSHLASAGFQEIRLWEKDPETGAAKLKHILKGHKSGVRAVDFSPDGKTIASAGLDGDLILWDVQSGEKIKEFQGHEKGIATVKFSPKRDLIASGDLDGKVILWDVKEKSLLKILEGHEGAVWSLDFDLQGDYLVTGDELGNILFWAVETGELKKEISAHTRLQKGVTQVKFALKEPPSSEERSDQEHLGNHIALEKQEFISTGPDRFIRYWGIPKNPFLEKELFCGLPLSQEKIKRLFSPSTLHFLSSVLNIVSSENLPKLILALSQVSSDGTTSPPSLKAPTPLHKVLIQSWLEHGTLPEFKKVFEAIQRLNSLNDSEKKRHLLSPLFLSKWSQLKYEERLVSLSALLDIPDNQFERLVQVENPSGLEMILSLNLKQLKRVSEFFQVEESLLLFHHEHLPFEWLLPKILGASEDIDLAQAAQRLFYWRRLLGAQHLRPFFEQFEIDEVLNAFHFEVVKTITMATEGKGSLSFDVPLNMEHDKSEGSKAQITYVLNFIKPKNAQEKRHSLSQNMSAMQSLAKSYFQFNEANNKIVENLVQRPNQTGVLLTNEYFEIRDALKEMVELYLRMFENVELAKLKKMKTQKPIPTHERSLLFGKG